MNHSARTAVLLLHALVFLSSGVVSGSGAARTRNIWKPRIIGGTEVPDGKYKGVARLTSADASCTATFVGPQVFLTAGHCVDSAGNSEVTFNNTKYQAEVILSPSFSSDPDHDLAVGIVTQTVAGMSPMNVNTKTAPQTNSDVTLIGYGCLTPPPPSHQDGILRAGPSQVTEVGPVRFTTKQTGGASVCYGDPGGPVLLASDTSESVMGIASQGDMQSSSFITRMDSDKTTSFLNQVATSKQVKICGINTDCGSITAKPTCSLTANPATLKLGESLTLNLTTQGQVTTADIDGTPATFPTGSKNFTPPAVGSFTAKATVTGPGGTSTCEAPYKVEEAPVTKPLCTLTANPSEIKLGETVTLTLSTMGQVTSATIEGSPTTFPSGQKVVTPPALGSFTATATVTGPGGSNTCQASYKVNESAITKPICSLAASPSEVKVGENVNLTMTTFGQVTSASIEGSAVSFPNGQKTITATSVGIQTVTGSVTGPGGTNSCKATFKVNEGPVTKPLCTLTANPTELNLGGSVTLTMTTTGQVTAATLEGEVATFPSATKVLTPATAGTFTANGTVTGPGGTSTCQASYKVNPGSTDKPSCLLTANPSEIQLGKALMLSLTAKGQVTAGQIEGNNVPVPYGQKAITPGAAGSFTAQGSVTGPGGTATCQANYTVKPGPNPGTLGCTVTASPPLIQLGESVVLTLKTTGNVTEAVLDGAYVTFPIYKSVKKPNSAGTKTVQGSVSGPDGTANCQGSYEVLPLSHTLSTNLRKDPR